MPKEEKCSPNDQRSDVFNPTSGDSRSAANNRSNQMNPTSYDILLLSKLTNVL